MEEKLILKDDDGSSLFMYERFKKEFKPISGCPLIKNIIDKDPSVKDKIKLLGAGSYGDVWEYCEKDCHYTTDGNVHELSESEKILKYAVKISKYGVTEYEEG